MSRSSHIKEAANDIQNEMYDMDIHETVQLGGLEVVRVPGGWMYMWAVGEVEKNKPFAMTSCFVPLSDEFDPRAIGSSLVAKKFICVKCGHQDEGRIAGLDTANVKGLS